MKNQRKLYFGRAYYFRGPDSGSAESPATDFECVAVAKSPEEAETKIREADKYGFRKPAGVFTATIREIYPCSRILSLRMRIRLLRRAGVDVLY